MESLRAVIMATILFGTVGRLAAAPLNLAFSSNKRRFDVERTATTSTNLSTEKWGYKVTVENKSFKQLEPMEVEYRVFLLDDERNLKKPKLKAHPGTYTLPAMKNGEKHPFETQPVELKKSELKAGWYSSSGLKEKVTDSVGGIWLKVKKDGEVVAEYMNPPSLKTRVKWE